MTTALSASFSSRCFDVSEIAKSEFERSESHDCDLLIEKALQTASFHLDLSNLSLKELSPKILELTWLKQLDLSGNEFETFPEHIFKLSELETLKLSHNNLESIPTEISNLTHLEQLFLDSNKISTVPDTMCSLIRLNFLDLSKNSVTTIPAKLISDVSVSVVLSKSELDTSISFDKSAPGILLID